MLEHALCRATLHMGKPAMLLLLLSALCVVSVPARPSLRPSSPEEFRKLLLWAQKAAENGEVQPSYPSAEQLNEVDKVWIKNHKKGYHEDADLVGPPYKTYVESSAFRRHHPKSTESSSLQATVESSSDEPSSTEAVPVIQPVPSEVPVDKRVFPKKIDHTRYKPISEVLPYYSDDDDPGAEKKPENLSHAAIIYVNDSEDKKTLPDRSDDNVSEKNNTSQQVVADSLPEETSVSRDSSPLRAVGEEDVVPEKKTNQEETVETRRIPPVWGPVFSDELFRSSVSRLPSYEEYDRNERYSHSVLHGFTGF